MMGTLEVVVGADGHEAGPVCGQTTPNKGFR